ncbi:hypothetical protein KBJ98_02160 [Flavobacterium sp. F-328]|uniref:PilZ domain-containing protein n=1 Tax=Flavobacterium erciyesense TaxID=2825842 RepID=A0ABS5D0F3_9FLAO|nr:hypothetical protein [Flavobacterium erciyesense]MBQ0907500.1 hypothetical protein [Flavobacterium erciyesense]
MPESTKRKPLQLMNRKTEKLPFYEVKIVSNRLGMSGANINFLNEEFFGLKPGELINQIGNGKENGTIRTDKFKYTLKFVGAIMCEFKKPEKMYAFELPEKLNNECIYFLYGTTGSEIFTEEVYSKKQKKSFMRFYAPVFIKA